jgi:hypothetical protein
MPLSKYFRILTLGSRTQPTAGSIRTNAAKHGRNLGAGFIVRISAKHGAIEGPWALVIADFYPSSFVAHTHHQIAMKSIGVFERTKAAGFGF